jgi:uncharacterized protein
MSLTSFQKTVLFVLMALFLASLTIAGLAVAKLAFARAARPDSAGGITVADRAEVKVAPDTAFVTFSVITKDKVARSAASVNANKTTAVIAAVTRAGIAESDIKTVDYSLEPVTEYIKGREVPMGYRASNSLRVRTKDIPKLGEMIDSAIAAGANNVQGVSFDVEDKKKLRQQALTLAVKKAEDKARAIAEAMGAKLGPAISANESVDMYVPETRNAVFRAASDGGGSPTPIAAGEATVSAQVKVVYSVR